MGVGVVVRTDNVVREKSYRFALQIVKLGRALVEREREYVLSKQVVRSGTSIGANMEEAIGAQSEKDFYARLTTCYKEARETRYWLRLLRDSELVRAEDAKSLIEDCDELIRIIGASQATMRRKWQSSPRVREEPEASYEAILMDEQKLSEETADVIETNGADIHTTECAIVNQESARSKASQLKSEDLKT